MKKLLCLLLLISFSFTLCAYAPKVEELMTILPGAKDFSQWEYTPDGATKAIWRETTGKGYILLSSTDKGFKKRPMTFLLGITGEGRITELRILDYTDTRYVGDYWVATFEDQDSRLEDVTLVGGVTYSSIAIRDAVKEAFEVLEKEGLL